MRSKTLQIIKDVISEGFKSHLGYSDKPFALHAVRQDGPKADHKSKHLGDFESAEAAEMHIGKLENSNKFPEGHEAILTNKGNGVKHVFTHKWEKLREEALIEGLRLIKTYTNGNKMAKVYKDNEWQEHRVKFYTDGKHHVDADHHSDAEDAHATARHQIGLKEEIHIKSRPIKFKNGDKVKVDAPHITVKGKSIHGKTGTVGHDAHGDWMGTTHHWVHFEGGDKVVLGHNEMKNLKEEILDEAVKYEGASANYPHLMAYARGDHRATEGSISQSDVKNIYGKLNSNHSKHQKTMDSGEAELAKRHGTDVKKSFKLGVAHSSESASVNYTPEKTDKVIHKALFAIHK